MWHVTALMTACMLVGIMTSFFYSCEIHSIAGGLVLTFNIICHNRMHLLNTVFGYFLAKTTLAAWDMLNLINIQTLTSSNYHGNPCAQTIYGHFLGVPCSVDQTDG